MNTIDMWTYRDTMNIVAADITGTTNLLVRDIHDPDYHSPNVQLVLLSSPFYFRVGVYHFKFKIRKEIKYVKEYI